MTRFAGLCLSALLVVFGCVARSLAESSTATLTMDQALQTAAENNPDVLAARKKWDAAAARIGSERTLDKPRVSYERAYSGQEKILGISQEFPFPGKLRAKGRVAAQEAAMAEQGFKAKEREVRSAVKSAYAAYDVAFQTIRIYQENVDLMRRYARVAESKYAVGRANQTDVLRAQIELSKALNMLVNLNQEKETAQAMLNNLLNRDSESPLGAPEDPEINMRAPSLPQLQAAALAGRPELLESAAEVERSRRALASSRLEYLPDFSAEFRSRQASNPEMDNTQDVMVGVTVPLWFWKQRDLVRAARADRAMSEAQYRADRNRTLFGVKDLLVKMQTAERMIELYHTSVLPQAEQALKVSESAYQADKIGFLDLIDVERNLLQFRVEHYEHLAEYARWSAELERVVGKDLSEVSQ